MREIILLKQVPRPSWRFIHSRRHLACKSAEDPVQAACHAVAPSNSMYTNCMLCRESWHGLLLRADEQPTNGEKALLDQARSGGIDARQRNAQHSSIKAFAIVTTINRNASTSSHPGKAKWHASRLCASERGHKTAVVHKHGTSPQCA